VRVSHRQRFGAGHLIDVLRGATRERIRQFGTTSSAPTASAATSMPSSGAGCSGNWCPPACWSPTSKAMAHCASPPDLRARLAREQNVPAYVIFHDATLRAIALLRPRNRDELAGIGGVGAAKLTRYGSAVLEAVAAAT
jgi:superfamily II DNA helicase RecQ